MSTEYKNTSFLFLFTALASIAFVLTDLTNAVAIIILSVIVTLLTALIIGLLKSVLQDKFIVPATLVVSVGLAKMMQLLAQAFVPTVNETLGLFVLMIAFVALSLNAPALMGEKKGLGQILLAGVRHLVPFICIVLVVGLLCGLLGAGTVELLDFTNSSATYFSATVLPSSFIVAWFDTLSGGVVLLACVLAGYKACFVKEETK